MVDLDGTLVRTDLLIESVLALLKEGPHRLFAIPIWMVRGKAIFKSEVAKRAMPEPGALPWRAELIDYLLQQRAKGRSLVLATASDSGIARRMADHLGIFDQVFASDGTVNLLGEAKRDVLVARFGMRGFDYAADGGCDLPIWAAARKAILVNAEPGVGRAAARLAEIDRVFSDRKTGWADRLKALRPHNWLKNLLVFVPLIAPHRYYDFALLEKSLLAFVAFGCCASSGYLFNDLVDLESDRHHPQKRLRAFAAGDLSLGSRRGRTAAGPAIDHERTGRAYLRSCTHCWLPRRTTEGDRNA